jgi:hypothetical protein
MKKALFTVFVLFLVTAAGCSGGETTGGTQESDSPSEEGSSLISTDDESSDPSDESSLISSEDIDSSTFETGDSSSPAPETVAPGSSYPIIEDSDPPSSSASGSGETSYATLTDDEKAMYLAGIMPIIDRHNDTRNTLMEAEETFTFAYPSLDNVEIYCGALTTAKTLLNAEYEDAYAVTPPGGMSRFHYDFYTAIYKYKQYVTQHLTYYEGVYQEGTNDQAYYDTGEGHRLEANELWWNYIMPEIEKLMNN